MVPNSNFDFASSMQVSDPILDPEELYPESIKKAAEKKPSVESKPKVDSRSQSRGSRAKP